MGFGDAWAATKGRVALWFARQVLGVKKGEPGAGLNDLESPDEPANRRQIATAAAYRHNPWVYAGSRKLAYSCGTVPPILKKKVKDDNGNAVLETVTEHPALDVLANPGEFYGWDSIIEACVWNLLGWGRAFVEKTGMEKGKKTVGFFPLKSRYMVPKGDAARLVAGYEYTPNSKSIPYRPEQIVFLKFYDPDASDLKGLSPLEAAHHPINIDHDASEMVDAALDNNLMTGLVLKSPGELTRAQVVRIYQQLEHRLAGPRKAFRPLIVGGGMEPVNVGNSMKDADFSGLKDSSRQEIMAALGVPPIKLGMLEGASFSNAREQNRHFWKESVPPILTRIYDAFNRSWLWPEFGREYILIPDPSAVFVDEEDAAERENRTLRRWSAGVITLNEAREKLGEIPLEDSEVGDKFQWELRTPPAIPAPGLPAAGATEMATVAGSIGKAKPFAKRRWDPEDVGEFAKAIGDLQDGAATVFSALMLRVFKAQREAVVAAVGESLGGVRGIEKDAAGDKKAAEAAAEKALNRAFADYADDFHAAYRDLIDKAADATAEQTGFDGSKFDISHARIGKFVDAKPIRLSRQVNETTMEAVKSAITEGVKAGDSVPEIEDRVREAFGDALDPNLRPALIARTETADAASFASVEAMKQSGVVDKKEWLATEDELVRPMHKAADGQKVGLEDSFSVGGEPLRWPGDTDRGSPANVINCRCVVLAVVD